MFLKIVAEHELSRPLIAFRFEGEFLLLRPLETGMKAILKSLMGALKRVRDN